MCAGHAVLAHISQTGLRHERAPPGWAHRQPCRKPDAGPAAEVFAHAGEPPQVWGPVVESEERSRRCTAAFGTRDDGTARQREVMALMVESAHAWQRQLHRTNRWQHRRARPSPARCARAAAAAVSQGQPSATTCWCTPPTCIVGSDDALDARWNGALHALIPRPAPTRFTANAGGTSLRDGALWRTAREYNCRWGDPRLQRLPGAQQPALRTGGGRRMIGWDDVLALGLPLCQRAFAPGTSCSSWNCRAAGWSARRHRRRDTALLDSPLGGPTGARCSHAL